jgi:hypothetical protein
MNGVRTLRIAGFAIGLPFVFTLSQQLVERSADEPVPGRLWALGALSLLFFVRALATEYTRGPEADFQKDVQWGLAAGGVITILLQLHG